MTLPGILHFLQSEWRRLVLAAQRRVYAPSILMSAFAHASLDGSESAMNGKLSVQTSALVSLC
jgi:hypothetical protein